MPVLQAFRGEAVAAAARPIPPRSGNGLLLAFSAFTSLFLSFKLPGGVVAMFFQTGMPRTQKHGSR